MSRIMDYKVVEYWVKDEFEKMVMLIIEEGYTPIGGLVVDSKQPKLYAQSMIKVVDDEK